MNPDPRLKSPEMKIRIMNLLKGRVIVETKTELQAKIAQRAGACAIVVLDKFDDSSAKMPDPSHIKSMADAVALPIIGRVRMGHRTEAQIMESSGANIIEESIAESDTPSDQSKMTKPCIMYVKNVADLVNAIYKGAAAVVLKEGGNLYKSSGGGGGGNPYQMGGGVFSMGGGGGGSMGVSFLYKFLKKKIAEYPKTKAKVNEDIINKSKYSSQGEEELKKSCQQPLEAFLGTHIEDKEYEAILLKMVNTGEIPIPVFVYASLPNLTDIALMMISGCDGLYLENGLFNRTSNPMRYINNIIKAMANCKKTRVILNITDETK